ncbi:putative bZIP transcription factor [Lyophyllum shimeji]|uniref:BZIP transcription factor n=1 Tax=Lyophyllum shimeji TaxID=47721 RepID=A0A9P3UKQ0_LYOSH|nr:putative bZIP transcription factor [Lyophyllum shimeji]
METFVDNTPLWDLSQASNFSQLADDDFLALLQKQFPMGGSQQDGGFVDGVNPQNISRYSLPSLTPPSEDSSPSPPNLHNEQNGNDDGGDPALKRKATDDKLEEEGHASKSQHTTLSNKKTPTTNTRRKSTGTSSAQKDESRLLKRKEQNRAAQRAFRERKEKHVKDLEDKVAALEAKNEAAQSENENLRDLLTRLQQENMSLKQSSFTFAVPKNGGNATENTPVSATFASPSPEFKPSPSRSPVSPMPTSPPVSTKITNPLEWSSLTSFDPAMLNLLDDTPQPTATEGAMQMDFGFGNNGMSPNAPFTTIASNPMFMSFASAFDTPLPQPQTNDNNNGFNFDVNNFSSWPSPPAPAQETSLDDLLAGYMPRSTNDFSFMPPSSSTTSASQSPVTHHNNANNLNTSSNKTSHSPSFSSSSSPSSTVSDPLFDTPRDSSASDSDTGQEAHEEHHNSQGCPKTKGELLKRIVDSGPSPFAPTTLRKGSDSVLGSVIRCEGTNFPKTQESDQNIEVLSAWRSITSNPKFKDVDINDLCTEFTNKAKCDGTKVVLEPQGVSHILQTLTAKK